MCHGPSLPLLALCVSAVGHAKEVKFVRRTVVGPDGNLEVLDESNALHAGFDVAANGQLFQVGGGHSIDAKEDMHTTVALNAEEDSENVNTGVSAKKYVHSIDEHIVDQAHSEVDIEDAISTDKHDRQYVNATVIRRNRQDPEQVQPCGQPIIHRNRHKMCAHKECGPPPNAYMIAIVDGKSEVESFSSEEDVLFDGYYSGDVTRTQLDSHMTPNYIRCRCDGCDEWNDWAIKQLAEPDECKYPGHVWNLVFSRKNDGADGVNRIQTIPLHVGKVLTLKNVVMEAFKLERHMTKGVFDGSDLYKNVAGSQPDKLWEDAHTVHYDVNLLEGQSMSVWQYTLRCKLYNKAGMYINEAQFKTPHIVHNDKMKPPTCNPNQDGGFQECQKLSEATGTNKKETPRTEQVWKVLPFD